MQQIISLDRLQSAQRVLFIFDLAFKDFLSIQSYLFEFSKRYPSIKIDLWVNANCECFFGHRQSFKEKLFIEFLQECSFINKFYFNTCYAKNFKNICAQARALNYSIIVILSEQNHCRNIKLAKKINKNKFLFITT